MRKVCHLLVSLALFGWTGAVNAGLMQEISFYFPGDGTVISGWNSSKSQQSLLSSLRVTVNKPSGLCISPCWEIMIKPSASEPSTSSSGWVPGSIKVKQAKWSAPGDDGAGASGPVEFDPLEITAELFSDDPVVTEPIQAIITSSDELPGESGRSLIEDRTGAVVFYNVEYCEPETQAETCTEGSAIGRSVPLPSTLLLFGIGLFGLAGFKNRSQ